MFTLIGWMHNMKKNRYIFIKRKAKALIKKLLKYLNEYNIENDSNLDFHTFFVNVLNYSEEDYIKLVEFKTKLEKKKKDRSVRKPRKINQKVLIEHGIGDIENPEYEKYWNIFTDYNEIYLANDSITGKKTLKEYFIYRYNYTEDKAYEESKKIAKIIFKKNK